MGHDPFGLVKAPGHGRAGQGEKMHTIHHDAVAKTRGRQARQHRLRHAVGASAREAAWVALVPSTGAVPTSCGAATMAAIGSPDRRATGKYGGRGQENLGDGWGAQLGGEIRRNAATLPPRPVHSD